MSQKTKGGLFLGLLGNGKGSMGAPVSHQHSAAMFRVGLGQGGGGLNNNGPHRLIGSGTIWRCGFVGGSMSLGVDFEVAEA